MLHGCRLLLQSVDSYAAAVAGGCVALPLHMLLGWYPSTSQPQPGSMQQQDISSTAAFKDPSTGANSALAHRSVHSRDTAVIDAELQQLLVAGLGAESEQGTEVQDAIDEGSQSSIGRNNSSSPYRGVSGGTTDAGDVGGEPDPPPKALADILEALIGAVYIDSGGDLMITSQVCQ